MEVLKGFHDLLTLSIYSTMLTDFNPTTFLGSVGKTKVHPPVCLYMYQHLKLNQLFQNKKVM